MGWMSQLYSNQDVKYIDIVVTPTPQVRALQSLVWMQVTFLPVIEANKPDDQTISWL